MKDFSNFYKRPNRRVVKSRVQPVRGLSMREIYSRYVQTGDIPASRPSTLIASEDNPVSSFGDVSDGAVFISHMVRASESVQASESVLTSVPVPVSESESIPVSND